MPQVVFGRTWTSFFHKVWREKSREVRYGHYEGPGYGPPVGQTTTGARAYFKNMFSLLPFCDCNCIALKGDCNCIVLKSDCNCIMLKGDVWVAWCVRSFNPLNPELNPICCILALLAHHFLHVSRIRVKSLTIRLLMSHIYIYIYIYMEHLFLMFLDHTQGRTTVGRTPLDKWSARRRDLYLTTHDTRNRQISMSPVGFEPTILTL